MSEKVIVTHPRLGRIPDDGSRVVHPQLTVNGHPYELPAGMLGLDDGYFVALDPFIKPDPSVLDDLRALIASAAEDVAQELASTARKKEKQENGKPEEPASGSV